MTMAVAPWPTRDEYDIAVARWTETIWDADIRSGTLAYDNMGICRFGGANLYVSIYKIGDWMIRCFCSKPGKQATPLDIRERYIAIDRFCRANASRVSALIPITYLEQGISVGVRVLPIVKMPFLKGCPSLGEFLLDSFSDPDTLQRLCDAWLLMIRELEAASMAHGDLDLTNVLVQQQGSRLLLKLIDYDNTWIPELAGHEQTEYGHDHFQHPRFMPPHVRPYTAEMDRFSSLVMYISLRTLVDQPQLYEAWGADEANRLLLSDLDFQNAGLVGSRLEQLRSLSSAALLPYIDELSASLREARMPRSLTAIAQGPVSPPIAVQTVTTTRSAMPMAPAHADWKKAVYNANAMFAPPPVAVAANLMATAPWRPMGAYQHAENDATHLAPTQPYYPTNPAWGNATGGSSQQALPTSLPPQPLFTGSPGYQPAVASQQAPQSPQAMPPQPSWSQHMSGPSSAPMFQAAPGMGNAQIAPAPIWNAPLQAQGGMGTAFQPPQTPLPPTLTRRSYGEAEGWQQQAPLLQGVSVTPLPPVYEDDRPRSLARQQRRNVDGTRRVLIGVIICLLVLIIVATSVVLVMILTRHHIGTLAFRPDLGAITISANLSHAACLSGPAERLSQIHHLQVREGKLLVGAGTLASPMEESLALEVNVDGRINAATHP